MGLLARDRRSYLELLDDAITQDQHRIWRSKLQYVALASRHANRAVLQGKQETGQYISSREKPRGSAVGSMIRLNTPGGCGKVGLRTSYAAVTTYPATA